jgi:hypothetical protein
VSLNATFKADFSSFLDAVQKAEVSLVSFETGSARAEKTLNRMTDSFTGRRVIQEATLMAEAIDRAGGVSTLTGNELARAGAKAAEAAEKMSKLGIDVPPNLQALADATKQVETRSVALDVAIGTMVANLALKAGAALKSYGTDAVMTAANVENLRSVSHFLGAQSGFTASEIDALAGSLNKQGITTRQSYDTIIQMVRANMSLADATQLATVAQSLARATGENSSETLGKLIRGTQTLQVETLRNAGVVIQLDQEYRKWAQTQGRTVESLSATEKQQIALAAVLREGEKVAGVYGVTNENVGGKIQSMKRHQEDASKAIGDVFLPALRLGTDGLTEFYGVVQEAPGIFAGLGTATVIGATGLAGLRSASSLGLISTAALAAGTKALGVATLGVPTAMLGWNWSKWIADNNGWAASFEYLGLRVQGLSDAQAQAALVNGRYIRSAEGQAFAAKYAAEAEAKLKAAMDAKARAISEAAAKEAQAEAERLAAAKEAEAERKRMAAEAVAAAKRYQAAMEELQSSGDGWRGTLAGINAEVVTAVKGYLEAGVSQAALATVYGLTATQIKSVASALAEENRLIKENEAATEKAEKGKQKVIETTAKLWNEYHKMLVEQTGTTTDIKIAEIKRWAADVEAEAIRAGGATEEFYEALEARSQAAIAAVMVDHSALRDHSRLKLDETAERARATYEAMLARSGEFSIGTIEEFRKTAEAAELAAAGWSSSFGSAFSSLGDEAEAASARMSAAAASVSLSWNQAMDLVRQGQGTMSGQIAGSWGWSGPEGQVFNTLGGTPMAGPNMNYPGFASGVENFKGGMAYVHKDEMLVNLPPGTDVIPNISATAGGRSVVNNFSVTVSAGVGSSNADVARAIKLALVEAARDMGRRLPAGGRG